MGLIALLLAAQLVAQPGATSDVRCEAQPKFSYALYAPPGYDPAARWPILYVFDPRGRARLALELFQPAAAVYGWLIASSYDTRSDDVDAPNAEATSALWQDTHARLPLAPRRAYAAGFSGGARLAFHVGEAARGELVGVIAAGAGFLDPDHPPHPDFAVFATVGTGDSNFQEMRALPGQLARAPGPVVLAVFDGGHAWPPPALASAAVRFLELDAVRRGMHAAAPALVAEAIEHGAEQAREREGSGDLPGALDEWEALARTVAGLSDTDLPRREMIRLRALSGLAAQQRSLSRIAERERALLRHTRELLARMQPALPPPSLPRLIADLDLDRLRAEADAAPPTDASRSVQRVLDDAHAAAGATARDLLSKREWERAALALSVAVAVRPSAASDRYNLACAWARAGKRKEALAALQKAVDSGFRDGGHMAADTDLISLRASSELQALLARLSATP